MSWDNQRYGDQPSARQTSNAAIVLKDRNPDHYPATTDYHLEDRGADVLCILQVRDLGALTMRAEYDETGKMQFRGMSIFTRQEIGYYDENLPTRAQGEA